MARGDDVARIDAAQGHAVGLEGACDEEHALVERLEEHDALAAEAAGEEDQDGAGLERGAQLRRADGLAGLCVRADVLVCMLLEVLLF